MRLCGKRNGSTHYDDATIGAKAYASATEGEVTIASNFTGVAAISEAGRAERRLLNDIDKKSTEATRKARLIIRQMRYPTCVRFVIVVDTQSPRCLPGAEHVDCRSDRKKGI